MILDLGHFNKSSIVSVYFFCGGHQHLGFRRKRRVTVLIVRRRSRSSQERRAQKIYDLRHYCLWFRTIEFEFSRIFKSVWLSQLLLLGVLRPQMHFSLPVKNFPKTSHGLYSSSQESGTIRRFTRSRVDVLNQTIDAGKKAG